MRIPVKIKDERPPEDEYIFGKPGWNDLIETVRGDRPSSREFAPSEDEDRDHETPAEDAASERGSGCISRDDLSGGEGAEDWKNKYVRLLADFENYKRHAAAERERLAGIGGEAVLDDLFPMVEHMERAIKAARDADEQNGILRGLEMVYRELLGVLQKHGVERVPTVGLPFDPAVHEAVSVVPDRDRPEGTIVEELKPGFIRRGRLLRAATVVVAG